VGHVCRSPIQRVAHESLHHLPARDCPARNDGRVWNPVPLNNQFGEYLQWGAGRQPDRWENGGAGCGFWGNRPPRLHRNNAITFVDLLPTPQTIRVYSTDAADYASGKRVLIQGLDANGLTVYSQDVNNQVEGIFVNIDAPFRGYPHDILEDHRNPERHYVWSDSVLPGQSATGTQYPLHTMEPSEQTALYRRYYLNQLPMNCCHTNQKPVPAIASGHLASRSGIGDGEAGFGACDMRHGLFGPSSQRRRLSTSARLSAMRE